MTAAERLLTLAGVTGTAGALLMMIGSGASAESALVDYSRIDTATAATHLLVDKRSPILLGHRPKPIDRTRENDEALLLALLL
jgi:hypothetical protein